jgi:dTDP-4-dehydrorhamnose reductase
MTLSVLVFGQSGQVATALRHLAGGDLAVTALGRGLADLRDPGACAAAIGRYPADVVINAAAYTAVDRAETDRTEAATVNAAAPAAMARAAAAAGVPFLQISTDYVFDGRGSTPLLEDDPVAPLGVYGQTKLDGERGVLEADGDAAILRVSRVYAAQGTNFLRTMLRSGLAGRALRVVDDQIGGPTPAADVAETLVAMARAFKAGRGVSGVFHYCAQPAVSFHAFAQAIFDAAGLASSVSLSPIPSRDWPTPAVRPLYTALDCSRIAAAYGIVQPDWRASLPAIVEKAMEDLS